MDRNIPLAIALMMSGFFMVIPTPDELLIHPFIGYIYTILFNIDLKTGIIWSIISYNCLGVLMMLISIIIGGRYVLTELNTQINVQANKLSEQLKYNIKSTSSPISYLSYNEEIATYLSEYQFELLS